MKIFPIEKVREADEYTIKKEPIKSLDLMERAASQCYKWIRLHVERDKKIKVIVGPGNNGGDGLVVARMLSEERYHIEVLIIRFTDKESEDFSANLDRLKEKPDVVINEIKDGDTVPGFNGDDILVDGIFGSGLTRPVKGFIADVIDAMNKSNKLIIAIDIPSGLFADKSTVETESKVVEANYTLSFQFPKLAFFFAENDGFVGHWQVLPIGLHEKFIRETEAKHHYIQREDVKNLKKKRGKFSHKGNFGHGLLVAGGYGKMGAAVMSSAAAIRSGAGLITAHIPKKGYDVIQISVPEVMTSIDRSDEIFSEVPDLSMFNAIAVGPGIGTDKQTRNSLKLLIQNADIPVIFDADAINILGENRTWISFVPPNSIFTPHPKEFERITEKASNNFERFELQKEFSIKNRVYVVLKGAYTCITTPGGNAYFNSTGNPGMASGGSGDVLTGILLGLLAQNYDPIEACIIGVYLHGLAADLILEEKGFEGMIARDIINALPKAFVECMKD